MALLDDFLSARRNSGTGQDLIATYLGEDPGQTYAIGNGLLRVVAGTAGGIYWHFLPYPYDRPTGFAKAWVESGVWQSNYNRVRFSFVCDRDVAATASGYGNVQFGTYSKAADGNADWQGRHFYHLIDPQVRAGRRVYVEINRTPQHEVGGDPNANYAENPTAPAVDYFDGLTRFYFDTQSGSWGTVDFSPLVFDRVENEPDQQIASLTYQYIGTRYEVTWSGPKNSTLAYDVVYSAQSLRQSGFESGTAGGGVPSTGNAYTNVRWASPALPGTGLYVAIRPQGQSLFTEVYIPSDSGTPPPDPVPGENTMSWYFCPYDISTVGAFIRRVQAIQRYWPFVPNADRVRWSEIEIVGGQCLVKVDGPASAHSTLRADPDFLEMVDLDQSKQYARALGYSDAEVDVTTLDLLRRRLVPWRSAVSANETRDGVVLGARVTNSRSIEDVDDGIPDNLRTR